MATFANASDSSSSIDPATSQAVGLRSSALAFLEEHPGLPSPGSGQTRARWSVLAEIGARDLCLAKVLEAHYDAQAILAELGGAPPQPGELWAVWAAEGPGNTLVFQGGVLDDGRLSGLKSWCSGADIATHALVTAHQGEVSVLCRIALDLARMRYDVSAWQAVGMSRVSSGTLKLENARARRVGRPGRYLSRAGFWHGGAGVAACWYGAAVAVAERLRLSSRVASDPHSAAHLGAIDVALGAARALLLQTADLIDALPSGGHQKEVLRLRSAVESACRDVVDRVGRALGAGPLCTEQAYAQRCADLLTFIRQHHAERDLQHLGEAVAHCPNSPWSL